MNTKRTWTLEERHANDERLDATLEIWGRRFELCGGLAALYMLALFAGN